MDEALVERGRERTSSPWHLSMKTTSVDTYHKFQRLGITAASSPTSTSLQPQWDSNRCRHLERASRPMSPRTVPCICAGQSQGAGPAGGGPAHRVRPTGVANGVANRRRRIKWKIDKWPQWALAGRRSGRRLPRRRDHRRPSQVAPTLRLIPPGSAGLRQTEQPAAVLLATSHAATPTSTGRYALLLCPTTASHSIVAIMHW